MIRLSTHIKSEKHSVEANNFIRNHFNGPYTGDAIYIKGFDFYKDGGKLICRYISITDWYHYHNSRKNDLVFTICSLNIIKYMYNYG